jgi:hypothetical protein
MNKLTAYDIKMMLLELECATQHRLHEDTHRGCIAAVRDTLLRAALSDVTVEQERAA